MEEPDTTSRLYYDGSEWVLELFEDGRDAGSYAWASEPTEAQVQAAQRGGSHAEVFGD